MAFDVRDESGALQGLLEMAVVASGRKTWADRLGVLRATRDGVVSVRCQFGGVQVEAQANIGGGVLGEGATALEAGRLLAILGATRGMARMRHKDKDGSSDGAGAMTVEIGRFRGTLTTHPTDALSEVKALGADAWRRTVDGAHLRNALECCAPVARTIPDAMAKVVLVGFGSNDKDPPHDVQAFCTDGKRMTVTAGIPGDGGASGAEPGPCAFVPSDGSALNVLSSVLRSANGLVQVRGREGNTEITGNTDGGITFRVNILGTHEAVWAQKILPRARELMADAKKQRTVFESVVVADAMDALKSIVLAQNGRSVVGVTPVRLRFRGRSVRFFTAQDQMGCVDVRLTEPLCVGGQDTLASVDVHYLADALRSAGAERVRLVVVPSPDNPKSPSLLVQPVMVVDEDGKAPHPSGAATTLIAGMVDQMDAKEPPWPDESVAVPAAANDDVEQPARARDAAASSG